MVATSRKIKTIPPSVVKKDKQSKHSGSVAAIQTKTDRSIVSPSIGSPYEHTAKSLVQNISKKHSVVSAFDSNYDTYE